MSSNNPLKAYFRQPAIYFSLPSKAQFYPAGVVDVPPNGELPVYPMTTMDELALRNPDGMFNGDSTVRVIKNCIPSIIDPWQLNDIDMESVVIAIRAASGDGKMEIITTCPSCTEETKFDVDLLRMLAERSPSDYTAPLTVGELNIYFKPLTYGQTNKNGQLQFEIQREVAMAEELTNEEEKQRIINECITKLNSMMMDVISQTVDKIATPETTVTEHEFIKEFLLECDSKTHNAVKEHSIKMKRSNEIKPLNVTCPHCQHKYEQPLVLNFTDFFG
jgi:hypothetical protein